MAKTGENHPWLEPDRSQGADGNLKLKDTNHCGYSGEIREGFLGEAAPDFPGKARTEDISERCTNSLCKGPGAGNSVCPQNLMGKNNPDNKSIQFTGEMRFRDTNQPTPEHTVRKQQNWDWTLHTPSALHESQSTALSKGMLACLKNSWRCN